MAALVERLDSTSAIASNVDLVAAANPPGQNPAGNDAITRRMVKGFLDLFILEVLNGKPKHGYELMKDLECRVGTRVGPGTLYPLLYELEGRELIVGEWVTEGKTRKVYSITSMGEVFMRESFRSVSDLLERFTGPLAWARIH